MKQPRPTLTRRADPKTRRPSDDGTVPYFLVCPNCGELNKKGLSWLAANRRADTHRCPPHAVQ